MQKNINIDKKNVSNFCWSHIISIFSILHLILAKFKKLFFPGFNSVLLEK